ncbi:HD domain-containing protein [Clostridium estertheticum]|uniref:HD domain-containing protein n=1 Tax=Clostridium estertheticum TaxID=238834 RepID=UPI001C7CA88F|nr:ATP-binding protein [Clostridium estertheticum]MBX4268627.1 ATP-binding protein [Clostridium estertheticum]WLC79164.1 ATP-binding protein [Clostridium estertheticum]
MILELKTIVDTTLWQKLKNGFADREGMLAERSASNIEQICNNGIQRMKAFTSLHAQYTLHDEVHLLRVTEIMASLISREVINMLNPVEISLLILSAFFHDQGMILDASEIKELNHIDKFRLFKENWVLNHPNFLDIKQRLSNLSFSDEEKVRCTQLYNELQDALVTDYIRINHGEESKKYVCSNFSRDFMWEISGVNIAELVGKLCESHNEDIQEITERNGFYVDEQVGTYKVNMKFIAVLLRLADILDFDRDRTPDSLYKTIHFTSNVSINEWEKHKSVHGWEINSENIRYTMKCNHPIYQRVALQFMDWIDSELAGAHNLINKLPSFASQYRLNIPLKVDRSRIVPKDGSYIYHDLEFSLSRDEIVKLLMTDSLYENSSICIRELLQNSMDALRHRSCVFKRDTGQEWITGKVIFKHMIDEYNREIIICKDNGIGMDESIITRFLTNAGRSYYKSPEFQKEQVTFKSRGIDFNPCSQFGIGFMSCFMLGDNIIIETRRDYGYDNGKGKALIVEINGLNGIIVIREGREDQPIGTTIKIVGRTKPTYLDSWVDKVRLIETLDGYALACEFPIEAECTIEEIKNSSNIPPTIAVTRTFIENTNINEVYYKTFEQDLSEINDNLRGQIRVSLLINDEGKYVLENREALWNRKNPDSRYDFVLRNNINKSIYTLDRDRTCCDGILVCGSPGRTERNSRLGMRANAVHIGNEALIVDVRGDIKPQLTPSRVPKEVGYNRHASWIRIQKYIDIAEGRLWDKVIMELDTPEEIEMFLQLIVIYEVNLNNMSYKMVWDKLYVPIEREENKFEWAKVSTLNNLKIIKLDNDTELYAVDRGVIKPTNQMKTYEAPSYGSTIQSNLLVTIISMTSIRLINNEIIFKLEEPEEVDDSLSEYFIVSDSSQIRLLPYKGEMQNHFMVQTPIICANKNHSLVKYAFNNQYIRNLDVLVGFAVSLMIFIGNKENIRGLIEGNVSKWMYRIGCLYKDIQWTEYEEKLAPPYIIWTEEKGDLSIGKEDFLKWTEIKPSNLNEY